MIRVANCSGFYGDRLAAGREMVEDGPIDVLTGDYLAELTMLILARTGGYARTFLRQLDDVLETCLARGIKIVANAGGLDPAALAASKRLLRQPVEFAELEALSREFFASDDAREGIAAFMEKREPSWAQ